MDYSHEMIMPSERLAFKLFRFEGQDEHYVRAKHWHRSVEIFCTFEGTLDFYLNEESIRMNAGTFMIVNSNEVHSIRTLTKNFTVVIQIPLKLFEHYCVDENPIRFTHDEKAEDRQLTELIRGMYEIYEKKEFGYELLVKSLFYQLQYILVTKYRDVEIRESFLKQSKKLDRLSEITAYIREHYQEELSLELLAKTFGYSSVYLSLMFQKYAQINYRDYLRSIRLEYAREELIKSDKSLGEIALMHGFPNSKAFANAFKKQYQILPSEFRKRNNRLNK